MNLPGTDLTTRDLEKLAACGIPAEIARQALLRRVNSVEGGQLVGRNGAGDYSGIAYPYLWPGQLGPREYRLRRDVPEMEYKNGRLREKNKYLSAPGRPPLLYLIPGTVEEWLRNTSIPVLIVEGEKKALAAWTLAWHGIGEAADRPRFLPIGLPGVWGWRGTIGKAPGPNGDRRSIKGPIDDLNKLAWQDRKTIIAFDTNVWTNESVQNARSALTAELKRRGSRVHYLMWPPDTPAAVNGIDDMVGEVGPDRVLDLIESAPPADGQTEWEDPIPLQSRGVPAFQAYWVPGALGDMAVAVAKATETPLEMAVLLGLPVASCCLAGKIEVDVEQGYAEPVVVFTAGTMESGNRKTAVYNEMTRPLTDYESAERKRLAPEIKRAANKRKLLEERIGWLRKKAAKSPADTTLLEEILDAEETLPDIPRAPQLWTQDVTPEKLAVLLQDHAERMGVFSDEGDLFDLLAGRYTGGAPNFDVFLHGHSGSPVRVNRISRDPVALEKPLLSVGLSPQPAVLERLRDQPAFRGRGLLARFLYALPPSPLGNRKLAPQPCPAEVRKAYQELIARLIGLAPPTVDGAWQPWRLKFSDEAYAAWKQFQQEVEPMMRESGKLYHLRDWTGKLPGAVARLAGIFHAVVEKDLPGNLAISRDTMERSIKLGTALIEHALASFDLMEREPMFEDAQKILEWIRRGRRQAFTLRECFCAHQKRFRRVAAIRPALALLVEHGYLRRASKTTAPHRPSEIFETNPRLLEEAA
jgi:hypothetical protein